MGRAEKRRRARKGPGNEEVARRKAENSFLSTLVRGFLKDGAFVKVPAKDGDACWVARDKASGIKLDFTVHADGTASSMIRRGVLGEERNLPAWLVSEIHEKLVGGDADPNEDNPARREPGDGYADPAP